MTSLERVAQTFQLFPSTKKTAEAYLMISGKKTVL